MDSRRVPPNEARVTADDIWDQGATALRDQLAPATWAAFVGTALDGRPASVVAAELAISVNAVHIARSRVMARLRREAEGFLDDV